MERKRIEEEQRIMRDRQRIEELERQNHLKLESKEQILREKLAKEQQDIENLIKRKEKERENERLKQERLSQQLKKREETAQEEFWKSKNELEELETVKEVQRQRDRSETLRKIQQKKEANEVKLRASVANEVNTEHMEGNTFYIITTMKHAMDLFPNEQNFDLDKNFITA
jgi:hypothetical protein